MINIQGFVGLCTGFIALMFGMLSCALSYWVTQEGTGFEIHSGLWRHCTTVLGTETCVDILEVVDGDSAEKTKALRTLMVLGVIFSSVSLVMYGAFLFVKKSDKLIGYIGGGAKLLAGLCYIITLSYYRADIYDTETDLGYAFYLCIPAWIVAWISGGLMIGGAITRNYE